MYIITASEQDGTIYRRELLDHKAATLMLDHAKSNMRNAQMHQEFEVWARGRRGCEACIATTIYENSIVATADAEKITLAMMRRALRKQFPQHSFYNSDGGRGYLRMDADRWTGDRMKVAL